MFLARFIVDKNVFPPKVKEGLTEQDVLQQLIAAQENLLTIEKIVVLFLE